MINKNNYYYIVEGRTEEKIIKVLKKMNLLVPGKIKIYNVIQEIISNVFLTANITTNTTIILVFDTDVQIKDKLEENIKKLKKIKI